MCKRKILDKGTEIEIQLYGHLCYRTNDDGEAEAFDMQPHLVGKKGKIESISPPIPSRIWPEYGIRFLDGSYQSWFHPDQIKLTPLT